MNVKKTPKINLTAIIHCFRFPYTNQEDVFKTKCSLEGYEVYNLPSRGLAYANATY